jgi:hypothetical protein
MKDKAEQRNSSFKAGEERKARETFAKSGFSAIVAPNSMKRACSRRRKEAENERAWKSASYSENG